MGDDAANNEIFDRVADDRRSFLKKMVVGTAFAVPVVSSFSLTGMQATYAQSATSSRPAVSPATASPTTTAGATTSTTTAAPTTSTTTTSTTTTTTTTTVTTED